MKNKNFLQNNIGLWEEIFMILSQITKLSDYYSNEKFNNDNLPLSKLFYKILLLHSEKKDIILQFERIIEEKSNNPEILNSFTKLINFLLSGLHIESKIEKKKEEEKKNNSNLNGFSENVDEALNIFNENKKGDDFIQKNFFGIKKITKFCKECEHQLYLYNHFKYASLDLINITGRVNITPLFNAIFKEFDKNMFCISCKKNTTHKIKIEIDTMPKYLIILLYNHQEGIEIKFLDEEFEENYYLLSFIIKKEKSTLNKLFQAFKCNKSNNKEYESFWTDNDKIFSINNNGRKYHEKEEIPENPYMIIYKEKKEKKPENNTISDKHNYSSESDYRLINNEFSNKKNRNRRNKDISSSKNFMKDEKNNEKKNKKYKINSINNKEEKNKDKKDNINSINNKEEKNNDKKNKNHKINNINNKEEKNNENKNEAKINQISNNNGERIIRLYFKFQIEIYFIDIENTKSFDIILDELADKYDISEIHNTNNMKLLYNNYKIKKEKSPLNLNIPHGSYIYILSNS